MKTIIDYRISKFELHYFFSDTSHFMDAFIKNKCEADLLLIVKEIVEIFDVELEVNSEALLEGGLRDLWKFLGKNSGQIAIVISIIALILSQIPSTNTELENLQIENAKLEKIERQLKIQKLKREFQNIEKNDINDINIQGIIDVLNQNIKIVKHKSNFYYTLNQYPKITQISTSTYTEQNEKIDELIIKKKDFDKFILESDELPDIEDDTAIIEIVSPVLKKGKYKWKGIYNKTGQIIDFYMKDKAFKRDVVESGIPFKNGTCIDCLLQINQKMDEFGNIKNTGYSVITVLKIHDDEVSFETPQGKRFRDNKKADKDQYKLFADGNQNK